VPLVVLSYPDIPASDLDWIQAVRAEHDAYYYGVVGAHFTFVFPTSAVDEDTLVRHVRRQVQGVGSIPFVVRCAVVHKDLTSELTHVFLVPDEGFSGIVRLHDRLYRGLLAPELRLDLTFMPHIGVGNSTDPLACKALADNLNEQDFEIRGTVSELTVGDYTGAEVRAIQRTALE
jgi:hypothetical protein